MSLKCDKCGNRESFQTYVTSNVYLNGKGEVTGTDYYDGDIYMDQITCNECDNEEYIEES